MTETTPDHAMVVNADGSPRGVADISRIQSDATILMYEMAAAAGDDDAVDAVAIEWTGKLDPDSMGYTSAAALSLLARNVLGPVLEVLDQLAPNLDFRGKLAESRDHARETLQ
ncbi:hypothetical protein A2J03_09885 [Rhodococcus sp. EPR-157]|uniref:hypothetical protein n=1 Tax=Rhodococcus sp. EPR-157 TaxID=1813677 RepID=UPI0007BB81D6|nr:hypothetical protein [Rhodococcus sp. EPR-157]KZF00884.1 hypothetical protein A2J03_09885 [Rhodococcus sp. EPR-157]